MIANVSRLEQGSCGTRKKIMLISSETVDTTTTETVTTVTF